MPKVKRSNRQTREEIHKNLDMKFTHNGVNFNFIIKRIFDDHHI